MFKLFNSLQKNVDLTKDYLVQETVKPITKSLKKAVYSLIWGFFLIMFLLFLTLGSLRLSQEHLTGNLSSIPYFVAFIILILAAVLVWKIVTRLPKELRFDEETD